MNFHNKTYQTETRRTELLYNYALALKVLQATNEWEYQPLIEVSWISVNFKTPVRCPKCNKPLAIVQIQVSKVLEWSIDENEKEEEGKFEDNGQGSTEVFCYNCKTKIGHYDANKKWGLFPDSTRTDL